MVDVNSWLEQPNICTSCQLDKSCKLPFTLRSNTSTTPLQKIHCDLWGPSPITSMPNLDIMSLYWCLYLIYLVWSLSDKIWIFYLLFKISKNDLKSIFINLKNVSSWCWGEFSGSDRLESCGICIRCRVLTHLNKMVSLNENIVKFLKQDSLCFSMHIFHAIYGWTHLLQCFF